MNENEWMKRRILALLESTDWMDLETLVQLGLKDMSREYRATVRELVLDGKINLNREWKLEPVKKD